MFYVVKTHLGIIKLDENCNVVEFKKYKNVKEAAKNLKEAQQEQKDEAHASVHSLFLKNRDKILKQLELNFGLNKSELEQITETARQAMIEIAREKVKESAGTKEKEVIHGISAINDIVECSNLLQERLAEFRFGIEGESRSEVASMLEEEISSLATLKGKIESKVESEMSSFAPNMTHLLGAPLAAGLITKAKGLEKLARMPGSKIQILGAEKAMFRFLKTKRNPPKHGIIYTHPLIVSAPKNRRGKIARALAAKIALAGRVDFFKGEFIGDKLKKAVEEKAKTLSEK